LSTFATCADASTRTNTRYRDTKGWSAGWNPSTSALGASENSSTSTIWSSTVTLKLVAWGRHATKRPKPLSIYDFNVIFNKT